jgi:hypothetical protein
MRWLISLLVGLVPTCLFAVDLDVAKVKPFLQQHCFECHNATVQQGKLDLESLSLSLQPVTQIDRWIKIHDRIQAGEMPPANVKDRPKPDNSKAFLASIAPALIQADLARHQESGRTVLRRLNRTEYENTLRDLLDLPGLEVKDLLPDDGRAGGYDKSAAALDISPILLAKFGEAADKALDMATAKYAIPPEMERQTMYANQQYDFQILNSGGDNIMMKDLRYDPRFPLPSGDDQIPYPNGKWQYGGKYKNHGEAYHAGLYKEPATIGMFRTQDEAFQGRFGFVPIHPGYYTIQVSTWSFWWERDKVEPAPRSGALGLYLGNRLLAHLTAPSLKPTTHELTIWIDPKPRDYIKVDAASNWNVHLYFRKGQTSNYSGPGVAIDSLTVTGPIHDQWPPTSHQRLFGDLPLVPFHKLPSDVVKPKRVQPTSGTHDARNGPGRLVYATMNPADALGTAERLLKDFLPRAFRRTVQRDEVARYVNIASGRLADGQSFEDAMKAAYKTALCSLDFLFLREPVGTLDDHAIASRLSYFLWNSMPDELLLKDADAGKLRNADLRPHLERMLKDSKVERFVNDFLDQWLDLRDFDATSPDSKLYPEYRPLLADAMRQEPRQYYRDIIRENRQTQDLFYSNHTNLNQRLAEHYGIPGIDGTNFRQVHLPVGTHRGGLMTQAAILKVTANGTTTSPVKRGAWVQKKIVGRPPEPPPPNIAAVEPDVRGTTTIREQLAKHRDQASCASCHAMMDPPGFALESFDVIGRWRDRYRSTEKGDGIDPIKQFPGFLKPDGKFQSDNVHISFRQALPVDSSGELSDGRKFHDVDEFKKLMMANSRQLVRNHVNQLIVYATGGPIRFADRPAIEQILDRTNQGQHYRNLLAEIVQSQLFLKK